MNFSFLQTSMNNNAYDQKGANMNPGKKKPSILIAGAHGFVGSRAMEYYPTAIPVPSELLRDAGTGLIHFIQTACPDIIINAAAISDIRTCENHPEASYAANVKLPEVLAKAARQSGAKLISFSSDQVYTGCRDHGPYQENSVLSAPANLYARHKLEAEQRVLNILPDAVLLRATLMYDMPIGSDQPASAYPHANRANFLTNIRNAAIQKSPVSFPARQYRGITYVRQAVSFLDQAAELPGGIYNYGSENHLNMLETAKKLLDTLGLETSVSDTGTSPHNLWINTDRIQKHGIHFDTTVQGFRRCLEDYPILRHPFLPPSR